MAILEERFSRGKKSNLIFLTLLDKNNPIE